MQEAIKSLNDRCTVFWARPVNETNLFFWKAMVRGPEGTPYAGGQFKLTLMFPSDYPFSPPLILFKTKIKHCNISSGGKICLSTLSKAPPHGTYRPAMTVTSLLVAIIALLQVPNPEDPLVASLALMMEEDPAGFRTEAEAWTRTFASTPVNNDDDF